MPGQYLSNTRHTPVISGIARLIVQTSLVTFAVGATTTYNVTVDDSGLDSRTGNVINYTGYWNLGQTCSGCKARPDPAQIHNSSWHDATMSSSNLQYVSFVFTGSAIYAYGLLSNKQGDSPTGTSQLHFAVDNQDYGHFDHIPDGTAGFTYNALLFSADTLPYGLHEFVIQNGVSGGVDSLLLFDYLV